MSADEYTVNDDERGNVVETQPVEDAHNRTFLVLASLLTGMLLLLSLCTVGFLLMNRVGNRSQQVAAIETQNAVILATNADVTRTIEASQMTTPPSEATDDLPDATVEATVQAPEAGGGDTATGEDTPTDAGSTADDTPVGEADATATAQ